MDEKIESKVRVTLPEYLYNIIINDEKDFEIRKNKLCNMIFDIYNEQIDLNEKSVKSKYNQLIQFSLTNENRDIYADIESRYNIKNKADYFRKLFFTYCDQPKYKRELLMFGKNVNLINEAIKHKKMLKIKYRNEFRIIEPYFLINSGVETRNYVFCYCNKNEEYRNYRLVNIESKAVINDIQKKNDEEYIKIIKSNFDPYLSYGKTVKVKFTKEGIKKLEKIIINRPNIIEKKEEVIKFECSDLKAKLYFPQFMEEAEILEPIDLRNWFREKFEKTFKKYEKI